MVIRDLFFKVDAIVTLVLLGFLCNNVRHVPRDMLKTEGDRSGGYSGKLDEPIVHGWGVEVCWPAFQNLCKYQAKDENARTHLARNSKNSFIRTTLCALTGQYPHQTCLQLNM